MSSPKETPRERSLRVNCESADVFAEKNLEYRERSAEILSQILETNTDKYNLTEKEKSMVISFYENHDAPTQTYDKVLKNSILPKYRFCAMVAESNVRARDEDKKTILIV